MMKAFLTEYELECPDQQRFFAQLEQNGIEVCGMVSAGDMLRLSVPVMSAGRFEGSLKKTGTAYTVTYRGIFCRLPGAMKKRAGLLAGAVICAAAIMVSERFVLNIKVLTDDEEIRSGVMKKTAWASAGSYPRLTAPR